MPLEIDELVSPSTVIFEVGILAFSWPESTIVVVEDWVAIGLPVLPFR